MIISKDIKFDCAHMLSNYEGKCANLHGHTYHGTVSIVGDPDPETGILVDYNEIKNVVDIFDHAIVFSAPKERGDAETSLWLWAENNDMRHVDLPNGKSTAENISAYICELFRYKAGVSHVNVKLSETDGSWAIAEAAK